MFAFPKCIRFREFFIDYVQCPVIRNVQFSVNLPPRRNGHCGHPAGFSAFLASNPTNQVLWKLLEQTWIEISRNQFPEVKSKVLSLKPKWVTVRQVQLVVVHVDSVKEALVRLLSGEVMVKRDDPVVTMDSTVWGDLEDKGGVFMGDVEPQITKTKEATPAKPPSASQPLPKPPSPLKQFQELKATEALKIHIPLLFATQYHYDRMMIEEGRFFI